MEKALQALLLAAQIVREANAAFELAERLISNARAEGRDITDVELDLLRDARQTALARLHAKVGG